MKVLKEFLLITGNRVWIDPETVCGIQEKLETPTTKAATVVYAHNNSFHLAHPVDEVMTALSS
jgi:hypothetical protein